MKLKTANILLGGMSELKRKLISIEIHPQQPPGRSHVYDSFSEADDYLHRKCKTMWQGECQVYDYCAKWMTKDEQQPEYMGSFTLFQEDIDKEEIIKTSIRQSLEQDLLIYSVDRSRSALEYMISQPQWQMERLKADPCAWNEAMNILLRCEGFEEITVMRECLMMKQIIRLIDEYHPLLQTVFPDAQMKLSDLKGMNIPSESKSIMIEEFEKLAVAPIYAAMEDDEIAFEKSWARLVDYHEKALGKCG